MEEKRVKTGTIKNISKKGGMFMKKVLALLVVLGLAFGVAFAHDGEMHGSGHMGMMNHGDMAGMGKLVFKGKKSGVQVKAWVNDIESAMKSMSKDSGIKIDMSKMDPNITHHIACMIQGNDATGAIKSATLKLSLKGSSKDYTLMSMKGHFGADVSMKEKGTYKASLTVETEKAGKVAFTFNIKN